MFVLIAGAVASQTTSAHGTALTLHIAGPGETPGHLDLLGRSPYSSAAVALGEVDALVLGVDDLSAVLRRDSGLKHALGLEVAEIARALSRTVADLAFLDLPRRLAGLLLSLSDGEGRITLALTQGDVAARLAGTRQSVNQAMHVLARTGLITLTEAGAVAAIDSGGLQRFIASSPR